VFIRTVENQRFTKVQLAATALSHSDASNKQNH